MSLVIVFAAQLLLGSGVLAGALYFTGEEIDQHDFLKCLGIILAAMIFSFVPVVGFLSGVVWIAAVMSVFEKTWSEALLIGMTCWIISLLGGLGLNIVANAIFGATV